MFLKRLMLLVAEYMGLHSYRTFVRHVSIKETHMYHSDSVKILGCRRLQRLSHQVKMLKTSADLGHRPLSVIMHKNNVKKVYKKYPYLFNKPMKWIWSFATRWNLLHGLLVTVQCDFLQTAYASQRLVTKYLHIFRQVLLLHFIISWEMTDDIVERLLCPLCKPNKTGECIYWLVSSTPTLRKQTKETTCWKRVHQQSSSITDTEVSPAILYTIVTAPCR